MHESYARPFEPPTFAGKPNPQHLELRANEGMGRDAALGAAPAED